VLGAVTVATAAAMPGTVAHELVAAPAQLGERVVVQVEHPSGALELALRFAPGQNTRPVSAELIRTARLLMRGTAYAAF
jgi:4-oxalomesaconate tautomerase